MNSRTSTLIIINNAAARARRAWPALKALLAASRLSFDVHETKYAGEATTRVRAALRAGYRTIAVVGGDGTLSEAAAGFFDDRAEREDALSLPSPIKREAALAILPAGTGDDFARGLIGRREGAEAWAHRLIAHCRAGDDAAEPRSVDVICGQAGEGAQEFICLNAATIGIGAEVASRVALHKGLARRMPGEARFLRAALGALAGWRERRITVKVEGAAGASIESTSNLIAIANGTYAGGGMMFAPGARLDDGLLDVVLAAGGLTRAMILRELPRIRRGAHLSNPKVRIIQATGVQVYTPEDHLLVEADGNVRGHTPASFRIMPGALRVIAGTRDQG
ncbi:MAG TPA: diacylglycerol kinase family protein [Pyrinomonadaceae bacterium]|jgi:YegS/Rv2252/BmrU family lipid kinase